MNRRFDLTWKNIWQILLLLLIVAFLYLAREAIGVLLIAIVFSLGIDPFVSFLEERGIGRLLGTLISFILILLILTIAIYFVIPVLILETGAFLEQINTAVTSFFGIGLPKKIIEALSLNLDKALGIVTAANITITGAVSNIVNKIVFGAASLIVAFYLSVEKNGTERFLEVLLPDYFERPALRVFRNFKIKIRRWFAAQIGMSAIVGVVVGAGLSLLGVKYALILGLLAAVFELVPVIGPVIAGMVAFLVAVLESFSLGLWTLLFFVIVQQIENHILIPFIMGRTMRVHPAIVIFALLAGGKIAGFAGIVLAVPFAVLAQEIFNYLDEAKKKRLELI